jgi:ABC-2 type transport system ATP-binding protein
VRHLGSAGSAVLLATQDLAFAEGVCDQLFLLHDGRLVAEGSPAHLRERYRASSIEETFLTATGTERLIDDLERRLDAFSR